MAVYKEELERYKGPKCTPEEVVWIIDFALEHPWEESMGGWGKGAPFREELSKIFNVFPDIKQESDGESLDTLKTTVRILKDGEGGEKTFIEGWIARVQKARDKRNREDWARQYETYTRAIDGAKGEKDNFTYLEAYKDKGTFTISDALKNEDSFFRYAAEVIK